MRIYELRRTQCNSTSWDALNQILRVGILPVGILRVGILRVGILRDGTHRIECCVYFTFPFIRGGRVAQFTRSKGPWFETRQEHQKKM